MDKNIINTDDLSITRDSEVIAQVRTDKFNSNIFKIKMGNIIVIKEEIDLHSIEEAALEKKFNHLSVKISTDNKKLLHMFEENGYKVMDTLVTYRFDFGKKNLIDMTHNCTLRDAVDYDLENLKEFAGNSFKIDRFHSDTTLDNSDADKYYSQWIENSYNGYADKVIVADIDGEAVGFTTCKLPNKTDHEQIGRMVLSAVSEKSRGKGVYTSMIHEGILWFKNKTRIVEVGTQINNYPVQKTWINLGMFLTDSSYILHKRID